MSVKSAVKSGLTGLKRTYLDNESVSIKEQLGYAGGIFGNAMGQDSIGTFAGNFGRDYAGLTNGMSAVKDNISTILSFIVPPVAGALYDMPIKNRKRSNLRTALFVTPVPFAITSMLLFIVPTHSAMYNFIWTLFLSIFFSIADTFYDIALASLGLKMVSDPSDRKKFFTFESIAATLGSLLPGGVIPVVVGLQKTPAREQWSYFFVALGFCVIGVAAMYAPYMTIQERVSFFTPSEDKNEEKVNWNKDTVLALLHNRPFMVLMISNIFETIRKVTYDTLIYLYKNTFDDLPMKTIVESISGALSYVGLMAVPFVGKKISAKAMLSGGYYYTAFFYTIISSFNIKFNLDRVRKLRYIPGICIAFAGMPNAAQGAARRIIVGDSTDYMEWYSEKKYGVPVRSDGLLCAAQNIVAKITSLIKVNLTNGLLAVIGYRSKNMETGEEAIQTPRTLRGIYAMVSLCGLIGSLLPALCFLFDNYSGKRKEAIYAELLEMRALRDEKLEQLEDGPESESYEDSESNESGEGDE